MGFLDKFLSRTKADGPIWEGVPSKGRAMDQKPDIVARFAGTSWRSNDAQHALAALALSTDSYMTIGNEGFYVFDLQGDATVVSKLSAPTMALLDAPNLSEFEVRAHRMPTYPVLRACLHWRRKDGKLQTQENMLDVTWKDAQNFFDAMLQSSRVVIHVVESVGPIPRFSIRMNFDARRRASYRKELAKAVRWYSQLPESTRDFRAAVERFWETHPL